MGPLQIGYKVIKHQKRVTVQVPLVAIEQAL